MEMSETKSKVKRVRISPDEKHFAEIIWERIIMRGDIPIRQAWLFKNSDFPCGQCKRTDGVLFMSLPTGIFKTCSKCGFTHGIEPTDDKGNYLAILIKEEQVSPEKALAICKKHKSNPPAGLRTFEGEVRKTEEGYEVEE